MALGEYVILSENGKEIQLFLSLRTEQAKLNVLSVGKDKSSPS